MKRERVIEIPVSKVVKSYFMHPLNLGTSPTIEKRHWLGRFIVNLMSYVPLESSDLPVDVLQKDVDGMELLEIEISFPCNLDYMSSHHLIALGYCLENAFEISLMNFCRGRFAFSPNYHAAIQDFFTRYGLADIDIDQDYFRRFIHKKYGKNIRLELEAVDRIRLVSLGKLPV